MYIYELTPRAILTYDGLNNAESPKGVSDGGLVDITFQLDLDLWHWPSNLT